MMKTLSFSLLISTMFVISTAATWKYVHKNAGSPIPAIPFPYAELHYKLGGGESSNLVTALELDMFDEGPGYHSHIVEDKMYFVQEGRVQFIVDDKQFCAKPGDYVYVPRPLKQTFRVYNPTGQKNRTKVQLVFFPAGGTQQFLNEMTLVFLRGRLNNATLVADIQRRFQISTYGSVQWEDLGCFDEN